ncbi:hypothetical protein EC988_002156 [Linderina pennispora]|nr:hypothetical protein EC988_002156 [Linderina pennispora]
MSFNGDVALQANELTHRADDNDRVQYQLWFPFARHPTWQLVPIAGNIMVFIDTLRFVHAVNSLFVIPGSEIFLVYLKITSILFLGMIPCVGFLLTLTLKPCLCYMRTATACLPTYGLRVPPTPFLNVVDMFSPCNPIHNNPATQRSQLSKQSDMTVIDVDGARPQYFSPLVLLPKDNVQAWMDSALCDERSPYSRVSLSHSVDHSACVMYAVRPTDVNRESVRTRCMRSNMVYPNKLKSSSCTNLDTKSKKIAKGKHMSLTIDRRRSLKLLFPLEKQSVSVGKECAIKNLKGLTIDVLKAAA